VIFDGLDWDTTRAAAIYKTQQVGYNKGRGHGLAFQDYDNTTTDFAYFVSSPHNEGTAVDIDAQTVQQTGTQRGGYDPSRGGDTPWSPGNLVYLTGEDRTLPHAYTDSASSATSMNSGIKTFNGAINVDAHGKQVVPLARRLQRKGFAVGAVTSVPVSHATVATAYANNVSREDYQDLTRDMLGVRSISHRGEPLAGLDVLIGAGWGVEKEAAPAQGQNFRPGPRYLDGDTLAKIDVRHGGKYRVAMRTPGTPGNRVLTKAAEKAAANDERLFGMFGTVEGHLPFRTADGDYNPYHGPKSVEKQFSPERASIVSAGGYPKEDIVENPTLAEMTSAALKVLETSDQFWLMVEAGDVDWAMHANNLDNTIGAIYSGEQAFEEVVGWIEANDAWDDSAVIVTADHGHLFVLRDPNALIESEPSE